MLPQSGHKIAEGHRASHEPLNILDVPDLAYFSDGQNLIGVCFVATLSEELTSWDPEGALLQVQLNVESPEAIEGFFQVGDEATALLGFYDDVVDIDLQVTHYLPLEAKLHAPLICGPTFISPNGIFT
jgi:hypothetical protein